ncbi:sen15 protein [Sarocladium implicatum]|nr:sen15 protein [Sarocladium implicatum]
MAQLSSSTAAARNLTNTVLQNLQDQHDWTTLQVFEGPGYPRPVIKGLPPRRLYIHPDDQIEALIQERATGQPMSQAPEEEWVLPIHLTEQWTISRFSAVFDTLDRKDGARGKRLVLATVHNDSTVVYYLMHEGMVKPRQN